MGSCGFNYGTCDRPATTTLKKNNGQVVQLCELHHDFLIKIFGKIADGIKVHRENGEAEANHWFILNKIPR